MDYKDSKENILNELRELDSTYLTQLKNQQNKPDLIEDYLSEVYHKVIERKESQIVTLIKRPQTWLMAASLVILFTSLYLLHSAQTSDLRNLDDQEILAYLIESDIMTTDDLNDLPGLSDQLSYDIDINDDDIINYLDDDLENLDLIELNTY